MPKKKMPAKRGKRALAWLESSGFIGWSCKGCWWLRPSRSFLAAAKTPSRDTQDAFNKHDCNRYPKHAKKRKDSSQAAAPIVPEATKH
ncbi:MAG: hypothetical protein LAN37_04155 [Acidobacteriia bacterium]|nr:hypothetical protein [Terriglobia bacterium]